ncbi:MAG TPA: hypothetical protein VN892_09315 [Solirubrobacteraceae bacterium]|jgi:hypothetical protein|nr:hypothetical protein [Solirubrobacteraceae bacterium]
MTRFFLPSSPQGDAAVESGYKKLREQAEACTGSASRDRRIREIECRRQGLDCLLRVGEPDAIDGRTVAAILQLGRDTYTVHHVPSEPDQFTAPTVLQRTEVYSVADFD